MFLDEYARAFADAGFAALAYDHFGFGASDGEPRQWPEPGLQLQGYRDAIAWLADRPGIEPGRIGVWGSSWSGGQAIVLAAQAVPIRCAVAQVPTFGAGAPARSRATIATMERAVAEGRTADTIPVVRDSAEGLGLLFNDQAAAWFARVSAQRAPSWRNEVGIGALLEPFAPIDHLPDARVPLLLIVASDDRLTPPAQGVAVARTVAGVEVVQLAGDHFAAYEAGFAASSGAAVDFFRRHLAG